MDRFGGDDRLCCVGCAEGRWKPVDRSLMGTSPLVPMSDREQTGTFGIPCSPCFVTINPALATLREPLRGEGGFLREVIMQDREAQPVGPTDNQKLRDRIFQQRLWIEHLKSSAADRETVRRAIVDLQAVVSRASEDMPSRRKVK